MKDRDARTRIAGRDDDDSLDVILRRHGTCDADAQRDGVAVFGDLGNVDRQSPSPNLFHGRRRLCARSQRQTEAAEHIRIALQAYDVQDIDTLIGERCQACAIA